MKRLCVICSSLTIALLASTGCATKMFVRNRTDPIDERLAKVDERAAANAEQLDALADKVDRDVSRLDERTLSAQTHADEAIDNAKNARQAADAAGESAEEAQRAADLGLAGVDGLTEALSEMQDFELAQNEQVYFKFDSSELTPDAIAALSKINQAVQQAKTFAIVVEGFTDSVGAQEYNLALSKRRAEVVVRHLSTDLSIPLYRIHQLGKGVDKAGSDRKQNRRVDVKLFVASTKQATTVSEVR